MKKLKKDFKKTNSKKQETKNVDGITLIALVITIIVLLILAGVSLSMVLSQDGIFSRTEKATDKYGQAKARETLELALGEAQMQKHEEGLTDEQLDNKINEIGELLPKEDENSNNQQVIVDGSIFEIDRSVPKIVDYIGPADGVVITAVISQSGSWQNPTVTVTGTIKTYSGGNITNSTATIGNTIITTFPTNGGNYTINNITEDTTIVINATDSEGKTNSKTINVVIRKDTIPPILSDAKVESYGDMKIKISIKAVDNESGVKQINYKVAPTSITPNSGTITSEEEIELIATEEDTEYTVTFTAVDNFGNISKPTIAKAIPKGGVIKHIKTETGLKEVNTRDIYGATVTGYTCPRDSSTDINTNKPEWQIFYIDEEDNHRVYLISKDYMAPPTIGTPLTQSTNSKYPKGYYINETALNNFKNQIPNNSFTQKFLAEYAGEDASSQKNLQKTNYMLSQDVWKEYKGAKADFAFGGATIPLYASSVNDVCKLNEKFEFKRSTYGYLLKVSNSWQYAVKLLESVISWDTKGILTCRTNGAAGFYLASPNGITQEGHQKIMSAFVYSTNNLCTGTGFESSESELGFRPIVALNTNTTFTNSADGSYTIIN